IGEMAGLKKQSQFPLPILPARSFITKDYEDKSGRRPRKTKAKQSQFPTPAPTKRAGKRAKSSAAANSSTG
ncbi:MAG: hypothetical protein ACYSYV_10300, partial [Planctomycetota bacterium]